MSVLAELIYCFAFLAPVVNMCKSNQIITFAGGLMTPTWLFFSPQLWRYFFSLIYEKNKIVTVAIILDFYNHLTHGICGKFR